jgi:hypothetical protein
VRLKPDGTQRRTEGEMKGKLANAVGSQYTHITFERGVSSITNADAHTSAASSELNVSHYIHTGFEVLSKCIIQVLIDCLL